MIQHQWDLIVIGGGPSGLNAASVAAENGLEVVLVDEQKVLGGQIYRNLGGSHVPRRFIEKKDYQAGCSIIDRFNKSGAHHEPETLVWFAEPGRIICSRKGSSTEIRAQYIAVATGAMERPVPFTGWTLPGVMGAGAADILYKTAGMTPEGPIVLAGNGPLIPLVGSHLSSLGLGVAAILDMTPLKNPFKALPALPRAITELPFLLKGAGMMKKIYTGGTPFVHGVTHLEAGGNQRLEWINCLALNKKYTFKARTLLYHQGVIPRTHMSRMLKLDHAWADQQRYWYPKTNPNGRSSHERIYVLGDGAVVHGAQASAFSGIRAGIDVAFKLNIISRTQAYRQQRQVEREIKKALAPGDFVNAWFSPSHELYDINDETLVCRCEGVRAEKIRQAVAHGCHDVNDIKIHTRCGMGNCQGRMCGPAMAEIAAKALNINVSLMGSLNIRPPVRPIPFGEICTIKYPET